MIRRIILTAIILGASIAPSVADTSWQKSLSKSPAGPFKKKKKC